MGKNDEKNNNTPTGLILPVEYIDEGTNIYLVESGYAMSNMDGVS